MLSKLVSIYFPIKKQIGITEIKKKNFANWISSNIKSFRGLLTNIKNFCCWQDDTIHVYKSLYLHCGPATKVPSKLKSIDENEDS